MSENVVFAAGDATSRSTAQGHGHGDTTAQNISPRRIEGRNTASLNPGRAVVARSPEKKSFDNAAKISPNQGISSDQVLRSFNTWAFKREQPSDQPLMLKVIADAIARNAPLPFLFYWGKGPRCHIDDPDMKCLDYLEALAHRVSAAYQHGAVVRLIFTNTHAELNGYPPIGIRTYFSEIEAEARKRGFECFRLGELIKATHATAEDDRLGGHMPGDMMEKLLASAMKWYHGAGSAEQGATKYFQMNMVEKRAVELAFPSAIFATFNSSKFRILFPKRLPIFYMYSLQRGVGVKPWFLPAEAKPCAAASCRCMATMKEPAERP